MSEAEARIKEEIYRSDLVLREVLKYIPSYKDRQNIELSSRRLYKLSGEVPCRMYASLRLTICHYNEEKKDKLIFLEKFNGVTYSKITNLTFRRKNHNSDHVLSLLGRRFWPEVHSMIIQECLDAELLTALDRYFPCINDITCSGFTPDALDFLAQNTNFTKKIEKLGFIDFEMPEVCKINIFKTLTALNHITCWVQRSWPFDRFVAQLEVRPKVEFISIQHLTSAGNEVLELSEFSRYCHKLQYTDPVTFQASMLNSISSVPNLSHLNVTLLHLSQSDVVDFFLKFNHFEMESLWLAECVYSNDLIKLIRQGQKHPQLQSLKLKCWELRGDYNIPLLSICPKTIKKLELDDCAIFRSDLQYLEKNCQQLEEFVYKPSVPDGLLLDQVEDESGCINYEDLLRLLINLPKLNVFHVNEFIEPEFLLILCSSLTNIDTARFLMRGVDRDRAYNVLSLFYESVSITHSYYPFRDKLPIFEEGAENDTDSDIKKSEIYRAYSNRYLTEWKDAVDEARGRTLQNYSWFFEEYLKPDLSKAISTTKWCFVLQHRRKNCPADIPNFKALFCIE